MKEDRKIKNVVLIMLDTLQFNYLGCYGNKVVKTPNIDRLARQGFLFENAYSEGLPTVPVRRALMTGRFTLPYGGWQPLAPDDTTVADIMWGKNMQTALVYDTPPMRLPKYGYSRGFDFVSFNPGQELDHTSFEWTLTYDEYDFVIDGTLEIEIDGRVVSGGPGDIIYIPKGSHIHFQTPNRTRYAYFVYPADWQ